MQINEQKILWDKLLSCKRLNELRSNTIETPCRIDPRNSFERDCDRITYSYPFRRLQDKTQVIPLPVTDFVHTRLTHSLEVTTVGRSFGRLLEKYLLDQKIIDHINCGDIPAILSAACLSHDIGNPPFGHSGENSIAEYFNFEDGKDLLAQDYFDEVPHTGSEKGYITIYRDTVSNIKCLDLMKFEGNANGFRILTKHNGDGLNLTAATLASFCKYPRTSFVHGDSDSTSWSPDRISQKKYGVFYSELDDFKLIAKECGLVELKTMTDCVAYARHPLAFLMEAADDICYRIIDLEDGHRISRIPFYEAENLLKLIAIKDERFDSKEYSNIDNENQKIEYLRSKCINHLVHKCFDVFISNYINILTGQFDKELLFCIDDKDTIDAIKELKKLVTKYVYNWHEVLALEVTGFEVLSGLISEFVHASNLCLPCEPNTQSKKALKTFQLLPEKYHHKDNEEKYVRYMKVIDYVSGMSDRFALNLFKKIRGINI